MNSSRVWPGEEIDNVAWSPAGKWIACGGRKGSFSLVAPDGHTQEAVPCRGIASGDFLWCPTNETLAVRINGQLSLIAPDGSIQKQYGKALSVDSWSSDGR